MGLAEPATASPTITNRTDTGGILRYGYCTPDFIMGSPTEARPSLGGDQFAESLTGVIFAAIRCARLSATVNRDGESIYNGFGRCSPPAHAEAQNSRRVDEWRVGPRGGLSVPSREAAGLAEASGHTPRCMSCGRFHPATNPWKIRRWLHCADDTSPVIAEVASKSAGQTLRRFAARSARPVATAGPFVLRVGRATFTFFIDDAPPLINKNP